MEIRNDRELEITKRKLRDLQDGLAEAMTDAEDGHLRELETESLRRLINQLREQIARYEAHRSTPTARAGS